jgi:flagellar protein FliO/FliZ
MAKESDDFQAKFINMLVMLALLIGLMIAASWMIKRMMKTRTTQLNTSSSIKVLETRYLSPRSTLYLLEINGKGLLVGESHTGITSLGYISLEEEELSPKSEMRKEFRLD